MAGSTDTTPRVRGLRIFPADDLARRRYNPACAGTTCPKCSRCGTRSIQPRVCGDYSAWHLTPAVSHDTTPRVRGLPDANFLNGNHSRYNPACAGTTTTDLRMECPLPIQPRVCGDYTHCRATPLLPVDTTPRVRGLPCCTLCNSSSYRYNPACAGTTPKNLWH